MGTKQFSNYSDLLTFTRASKGHALRPVSYGDELVTNGDFASDINNWTDISTGSATISYSSGALSLNTIDTSNRGQAEQAVTTEAGKIYSYTFTVTATTYIKVGTTSQGTNIVSATLYSAGTHTLTITALSGLTYLTFYSISNTTTVDNISVKEVLFDQPDGTLTLFEHPVNVPRVEWDSAGNRLGLLVEESRTNLIPYSEDLTNSAWTKTAIVTASTTVAPNGISGCSRVQFASGGGQNNRYVQDIIYPSPLESVTHTVSVWVKSTSGANQTFALKCTHAGVTDYFSADFTATSEWQRFDFSQAFGTGGTGAIAGIAVGSGGDAVDLEVWGFQFEGNASFPTSYIKSNSGSTTTRSADVASIPVADFGYNQSAGTFFIDITDVISNNNKDYFSVSSSGSFNPESFGLYGTPDTGSTLGYRRRNSAYDPAITSTADIQSTGSKVALSHDASSLVISVDGVATETSSSNSVDTITEIAFGGSGHGVTGDVHSKHIKSIKYYPRRLTNAQLVELTS